MSLQITNTCSIIIFSQDSREGVTEDVKEGVTEDLKEGKEDKSKTDDNTATTSTETNVANDDKPSTSSSNDDKSRTDETEKPSTSQDVAAGDKKKKMPRVKQDLSEISVEPEYTGEDLVVVDGPEGVEEEEVEDEVEEDEEEDDDKEQDVEDHDDDDEQQEETEEDVDKPGTSSAMDDAFQAKLAKYKTGGSKLHAGADALGGISFGAGAFLNVKNKAALKRLKADRKAAAEADESAVVVEGDNSLKRKRPSKKGM